jgi:hypothetical protein
MLIYLTLVNDTLRDGSDDKLCYDFFILIKKFKESYKWGKIGKKGRGKKNVGG